MGEFRTTHYLRYVKQKIWKGSKNSITLNEEKDSTFKKNYESIKINSIVKTALTFVYSIEKTASF